MFGMFCRKFSKFPGSRGLSAAILVFNLVRKTFALAKGHVRISKGPHLVNMISMVLVVDPVPFELSEVSFKFLFPSPLVDPHLKFPDIFYNN